MNLSVQCRIDSYRKAHAHSAIEYPANDKTNLSSLGNTEKGGRCKDSLSINKYGSDIGAKPITNSILDIINFQTKSLDQYEDKFSVSGTEFIRSQIPEVPLNRLNDIKAVDNILLFGNGKYYKYTDSAGSIHKIACSNNLLSTVYSENLLGVPDKESWKCGQFWNILSENATYIRLSYTAEEEKQYLRAAGITEGFFTVGVGNDYQEYFYSNGNCSRSVLKSVYDTNYNVIKNEGRFFSGYDAGAIFKIDEKEYVLSESHTLDIPYGADIFNIKYPARNNY
jgi:hypothetical protein